MKDDFDINKAITGIQADMRIALLNAYHRGNAGLADPRLKDYHSAELNAIDRVSLTLGEVRHQFLDMPQPKAKDKAPKGHRDWTIPTVRPDATRSLEVLLEDKTNGYRFVVPGFYSIGLNALIVSSDYPDRVYRAIAYRNPPSQELLKLVGEQG